MWTCGPGGTRAIHRSEFAWAFGFLEREQVKMAECPTRIGIHR